MFTNRGCRLLPWYTVNHIPRTLKILFFCTVLFWWLTVSVKVNSQTKVAGVLESRVETSPVTVGKEGLTRLVMSVRKGYKLAKRPKPKIEMTPVPGLEIISISPFTERTPSEDPDYFGRLNPVGIKIAAAKTTKAGNYSFEGKVTYFFCSEREMYCSRSIEPLQIPVEVIKAE